MSSDSKEGVRVKSGVATRIISDTELKRCVVCERREIEISKGELLTLRTKLKGEDAKLANGLGAIVAGWTPDGFPIDEAGNVLRTRLLEATPRPPTSPKAPLATT